MAFHLWHHVVSWDPKLVESLTVVLVGEKTIFLVYSGMIPTSKKCLLLQYLSPKNTCQILCALCEG